MTLQEVLTFLIFNSVTLYVCCNCLACRCSQSCTGSELEVVDSIVGNKLIYSVSTFEDISCLNSVVSCPCAENVELAVLNRDGLFAIVRVKNGSSTCSDINVLKNNSTGVVNLDTIVHVTYCNILNSCQCRGRSQLNEAIAIVLGGTVFDGQIVCTTSLNSITIVTLTIEVHILNGNVSFSCHLTGVGLACTVDSYLCRNGYILGNILQHGDNITCLCCSKSICKCKVFRTTNTCYTIVTINALNVETIIVENNLNLTCSSCGQLAISLIFACTDNTPQTVCVGCGKFVCTIEGQIAIYSCLTNYNRNECINFVAFNNSIIVVLCIHADTITVTSSNFTTLDSYALNSTKCQTALRVCYFHVLNCEIPT